jgi:homeobox protein cut-like
VSAGRILNVRIGIDLTSLIPQLDTVASDLVAHQRDALTQRKDLAQKTKDFRKLDDASKLSDIKGLLKCTCPTAQAILL